VEEQFSLVEYLRPDKNLETHLDQAVKANNERGHKSVNPLSTSALKPTDSSASRASLFWRDARLRDLQSWVDWSAFVG
jgi:hypothetical protein